MKKPLLTRILSIGALFALFVVVLSMISGLAAERQFRGQQVVADIARSSFDAQTISGPFLVLPYRKTVRWVEVSIKDGERQEAPRSITIDAQRVIQPESLDVAASFNVETRHRQLYEARLLHADGTLAGRFRIPARSTLEEPAAEPDATVTYEWKQARLVVGVSDARGIRSLAGEFGVDALAFEPGSGVPWLGGGVSAPLDIMRVDEGKEIDFRLRLSVSGTGSLGMLPAGKTMKVQLAGQWPHPGFFGQQLPLSHTETADSFSANWQTTHFASGITDSVLAACDAASECVPVTARAFGVRLVDPVDRYLLTERTLKYAQLFLLLTFGACFFIEVMKRVMVHPVQYALVGAAQAMFFLLVLSLAEHILFGIAYGVAAGATTLLLTYYGGAVLGGWRRGAAFGALIAVLYGLLYGILQSEDHALVMGSIALFMLLSIVMVATRRVNWFQLGETASPDLPAAP